MGRLIGRGTRVNVRPMRVAALTMVYNEAVWAPVWVRHYARQVGAEHCYVLDHGSDDGSTVGLGAQVWRLARSPLDEDERVARVRAQVERLLLEYDAVVHTDVDELVVADPSRFSDLRAYAAAVTAEVVTAVGLDVQHVPQDEGPLDPSRAIMAQRSWVRFSASMCKPVFVRRAVAWSPGFHACEAEMRVDGLFLLHLRYSDLRLGVERLRKTRGQAFSRDDLALHQRVPDAAFESMMERIAQLQRCEVPFTTGPGEMARWVALVREAQGEDGGGWLSIAGDRLWAVPAGWREIA